MPRKRKAEVEPASSKTRKIIPGKKHDNSETALAKQTAIVSLKRFMLVGAHVSAAGGVHNAIDNAIHIGANAFGLFLKSQRKWTSPALTEESLRQFHINLKDQGFSPDHIVPHGSYLVNLAQEDKAKADQSYNNFLDDLQRCEKLGIGLYNFHPGSSGGQERKVALGRIAAQLNKAHKATGSVITLIENMAGSGNVLGAQFEDLRDIITDIEDKSRVGVCLDTCHAFGAGYDLRTPKHFHNVIKEFDEVVGLKYLKALHLNDSKAPLASHRDLHANIGTGFLGLRAFHNIMNFTAFQNIPMILETPISRKLSDGKIEEDKQIWADEIKLLESLIGMDLESKEFKKLEEKLNADGAAERTRIQKQVDKKIEKTVKTAKYEKKKKN